MTPPATGATSTTSSNGLDDGATIVENGALLCERHHTKVHHGFRIERQPDGRWRTYRPDGTQIVRYEPLMGLPERPRCQTTRRSAVSSLGVSPVFTVALGSTSRTSAPSAEYGWWRRALRDDVQLTGAEGHVAVVHADRQRTGEHEEHLVSFRMAVPGELPLGAHDPEVVVVENGDRAGLPRLLDLAGGRRPGRREPVIGPGSHARLGATTVGAAPREGRKPGSERRVDGAAQSLVAALGGMGAVPRGRIASPLVVVPQSGGHLHEGNAQPRARGPHGLGESQDPLVVVGVVDERGPDDE